MGFDHAAVVVERGMAGFDDRAVEIQDRAGAHREHAAAAAGEADVQQAAGADQQLAAGAFNVDVARGQRAGLANLDTQRAEGGAAEDGQLARPLVADDEAAGQLQQRAGAGDGDDAVAAGLRGGVEGGGGDGGAGGDVQRALGGAADLQGAAHLPVGAGAGDVDRGAAGAGLVGDDGAGEARDRAGGGDHRAAGLDRQAAVARVADNETTAV